MYEPIVLRKRELRDLAGTSALKFYTSVNLFKAGIIGVATYFISNYFVKKKKLILELDEIDFYNKKLTLAEEYRIHEKFWTQPMLQETNFIVYKHFADNNQLFEPGSAMISLADLKEQKKDS